MNNVGMNDIMYTRHMC